MSIEHADSLKIVFSYAPADLEFRRELGLVLAGLHRRVTSVSIVEVDLATPTVGSRRDVEVLESLESADVIVMLLSPDYVACDETWNLHLPVAIDAVRRGVPVVPIRVRETMLAGLAINDRVLLPRFHDSVKGAPNRDRVMVEICEEISAMVDHVISGASRSSTADAYRPRRVLLAFANPRVPDTDTNISTGKECDELLSILETGTRRISVRSLSGASFESLEAKIREHQPDLIHLGAHVSSTGLVMLERADSNLADPIDPARLLELLTAVSEELPRCLVFNTCNSALFSLTAHTCIEHVVGLWGRAGDAAARCYARAFHGALARGGSVLTAHEAGVVALRGSGQSRATRPVYLRREPNSTGTERHRV